MNVSGPGISYLLLVIPALFALAVLGQGLYKSSKGEPEGTVATIFGIVFLGLIAAAYFLFIR